MSGITSVVEPIFSGIGDTVGGIAGAVGDTLTSSGGSIASNLLSDSELTAQQDKREKEAEASAAAKTQALTDAANQQIYLRNQALQSGLSHARAFFAAQGVDPNSGSADAYDTAQTANTNELNDYTNAQLSNSINDVNSSVVNLQSNDLLTRTQKEQNQLFGSFLS